MSDAAGTPGGPVERVQAIVTRITAWVTALPPVVTLTQVMDAYFGVAGPLLASGLSYGALITMLLGFLLFSGLLGLVIADAATREEVIRQVSETIPALAPLVSGALDSIANAASTASIVGLIGLAWAASGFYGSLDVAFGRIFVLAPKRSMLHRYARGLLSVLLLMGAFFGVLAVTTVQHVADGRLPGDSSGDGLRLALRLGVPCATAAVATAIVAIVYRLVPNVRVPVRALLPPAVLVGIVMALMTELFVFVAPRLVGALAVFGAFAAVFAALAWLSLGFQALLMGAAWTHARVQALGSLPDGARAAMADLPD